MIFCSVHIVWCNIFYLLYLLVCMYLCVTIDGAQFESPQEQSFEDVSSRSNSLMKASGPWSYSSPNNFINTHIYFIGMCLEYDGSQTKDMPSFFWTSLIKPGLLYLYCSYASCYYLDFGWITWKSCYTGLLMFWNTFMVIIKIIALIGTWRTT
jgi:hypothetical protein